MTSASFFDCRSQLSIKLLWDFLNCFARNFGKRIVGAGKETGWKRAEQWTVKAYAGIDNAVERV